MSDQQLQVVKEEKPRRHKADFERYEGFAIAGLRCDDPQAWKRRCRFLAEEFERTPGAIDFASSYLVRPQTFPPPAYNRIQKYFAFLRKALPKEWFAHFKTKNETQDQVVEWFMKEFDWPNKHYDTPGSWFNDGEKVIYASPVGGGSAILLQAPVDGIVEHVRKLDAWPKGRKDAWQRNAKDAADLFNSPTRE